MVRPILWLLGVAKLIPATAHLEQHDQEYRREEHNRTEGERQNDASVGGHGVSLLWGRCHISYDSCTAFYKLLGTGTLPVKTASARPRCALPRNPPSRVARNAAPSDTPLAHLWQPAEAGFAEVR